MSLKVIGHKAPDTDTVCSPIAYAWFLREVKKVDAAAFVSGKLNKETEFILNRYKIETPQALESFSKGDELVLMDTNNPEELLGGLNEAQIIEIVDHHKLVGGLSTEKPVTVTMLPYACTATIVWDIIKRAGDVTIPREIAGIMLCAILSDTLKFTSPTTTEHDKEVAIELAKIAGEEIDSLATLMFEAKSDLTGMTANDILTVDSKVFEFGTSKSRISVLETTKPENTLSMIQSLKETMLEVKKTEGINYFFFFVVDILKTEAHLIVATDEEKNFAEKAFNAQFAGETMLLPGVVSRKKQIIPVLESVIAPR